MRAIFLSLFCFFAMVSSSFAAVLFTAGSFTFDFTPAISASTIEFTPASLGFPGVTPSSNTGIQVMAYTVKCTNGGSTAANVVLAVSSGNNFDSSGKRRRAIHSETGGFLPYYIESGSTIFNPTTLDTTLEAYPYDDTALFNAATTGAHTIVFNNLAAGANASRRVCFIVNSSEAFNFSPGFTYQDTFYFSAYTRAAVGSGEFTLLGQNPVLYTMNFYIEAPMSLDVVTPGGGSNKTINMDNLANASGRKFPFALDLKGGANKNYSLTFSTTNGGKLRHPAYTVSNSAATEIPYQFYLGRKNGTSQNNITLGTSPVTITQILSTNLKFTASGTDSLWGYFTTAPNVANFLAGTYTDTVTIQLTEL